MKISTAALSLTILALLAGVGSGIDPSKVAIADKRQWCLMQRTTCNNLCVDKKSKPSSNVCSTDNLSWSCNCQNGFTPNATQYTQTIPFFTCNADKAACEKGCSSGESCILACRTQFQCTATDPPRSNSTDPLPDDPSSSSTSNPSQTPTYNDNSPMSFEAPVYGILITGISTALFVAVGAIAL